jgi:RNA polymerase sigma-70 factor (ECF subfamily)
MAASHEEALLLHQLRAGDETAFLKLVERNHSTLLRLARVYVRSAEVAEEVVQETWLGVLKGIDRFEGRSSLKTWIFRILTNRAKTRGEREARSIPFSTLAQSDAESGDGGFDPDRFLPTDHPQWPGHWALPAAAWGENPEERLLAEEMKKCILDLIDSLPEGQRAVITLRDLQGLTAAEVCNILEISESNQRVLLHRARTKVRPLCE